MFINLGKRKYEKNNIKGMHLLSVLLIAILFCLPMCAGGCQMQGEDPDIDNETIETDGQPNDSLLSNASSDGKLITVGFSQLGAESDWRVANTESIKESFTREQGFELMFDDAQQKQEKQIIAIRNFIQQEVDYIVLAPVMETGWDTILEEAKDAGIPVLVVDRQVNVENQDLFSAWIGSDFYKEGHIACEWLKCYTEKKGIKPEEINIVDIQGTLGATAQIGRSESVITAANQNGWNLLECVPADYTRTKAKEVMLTLLGKYDNINVVYCENDNEAMGVIEAIEESGKKVGTDIAGGDILIISFDAAHSGLKNVLDGKIALDVECNPLQGETIRNLILAEENGDSYEKYTYMKESAFSADDTVKTIQVNGVEYNITPLTESIYNERAY